MSTFLYYWQTSAFPTTDPGLLYELVGAVEGDSRCAPVRDDLHYVYCNGIEAEPHWLDQAAIEDFLQPEPELLARAGLKAEDYPSLIEVIQALLPDEQQAVRLTYLTIPGFNAEIWVFDKNKVITQSLYDAFNAADKAGIDSNTIYDLSW